MGEKNCPAWWSNSCSSSLWDLLVGEIQIYKEKTYRDSNLSAHSLKEVFRGGRWESMVGIVGSPIGSRACWVSTVGVEGGTVDFKGGGRVDFEEVAGGRGGWGLAFAGPFPFTPPVLRRLLRSRGSGSLRRALDLFLVDSWPSFAADGRLDFSPVSDLVLMEITKAGSWMSSPVS